MVPTEAPTPDHEHEAEAETEMLHALEVAGGKKKEAEPSEESAEQPEESAEQPEAAPEESGDDDWWASSEPSELHVLPSAVVSTVNPLPLKAAPAPSAEAVDEPPPALTPPADEVDEPPPALTPPADEVDEPAPEPVPPADEVGAAELEERASAEVTPETAAEPEVQVLELANDGTRFLSSGAVSDEEETESGPTLNSHRLVQGLSAAALRDIGRVRQANQDSVFSLITTLPRSGTDMTVGLFVVADGMGGHEGGEIASHLAVRTVVAQLLEGLIMPVLDEQMGEPLQNLMIAAVQAANRAIFEQAQMMGTDMGTTCTAALLIGHALYIAHVGDSRCYLYEPGGLRSITTDHSTVGRLIQLGHLDPSEAREHPLRNQLYRTVGQQPNIHVDFFYQPIGQASHLLLCSDGLWGMIDDSLMAQALTRSIWPEDACTDLINLANLAGGEDNISAVVVTLPIAER